MFKKYIFVGIASDKVREGFCSENNFVLMNAVRIIPRLDIKGSNLVKGIHLEGLRVLGKPENFARYYYEQGADELMYVDVVASLYGRNSLKDIITQTAKKAFIPLTVGGGLRTIEDIKEVLRAGADKVSLNTAAIANPNLIREAALKFGSSTIVVSIEAIRQLDGSYLAYTDNAREHTGLEIVKWAKIVEELGAGEVVITSVDREGTGKGFDLEMIRSISKAISIPVIAHGGSGKKEDVALAIKEGCADAVALASILHYEAIRNNSFAFTVNEEGNSEFLQSGKSFGSFKPEGLQIIKKYLKDQDIPVRL